ncbi:MAG: tripartite tricarboxylate transporter permease, partial [Burkholderiales bacterium]
PYTGTPRFAGDFLFLWDGMSLITAVLAIFAIPEMIALAVKGGSISAVSLETSKYSYKQLFQGVLEVPRHWWLAVRTSIIGAVVGMIPGLGSSAAAWFCYGHAVQTSRTPERFGHGAIEGVAAPEAANNAGAQTSFIPLLTLGLPSNAIMALMMGAMIIQGIQPGSAVMTKQPDLFWGMVASMWIGNLMLLVINLPLIGLWVRLLSVPYRLLYPAILLFCVIGIYSTNTNMAQLVLCAVFAVFGYVLLRFGCEPAPLVLGFILGPLMEENLRRSLVISRGDPMVFIERPISAILLAATVAVIALIVLPQFRKTREEAFQ